MDFEFQKKVLKNSFDKQIVLAVPVLNQSGDWIILADGFDLYHLDRKAEAVNFCYSIPKTKVPETRFLQMVVEENLEYFAITGHSEGGGSDEFNWGTVFEFKNGDDVMKLECGDYHTHLAPFPVQFYSRNAQRLVVHATDWNRLDITDLKSGKLLTERDFESFPKEGVAEQDCITEWSGELQFSPNKEWIATLGWHWHPVGMAFSWNFSDWLNGSIWEADNGKSKHIHSTVPYFWHGPFCWLDNRRLCLWGYEDAEYDENQIPVPSAAIYDVVDGKLINWFNGPTMDFFEFDQYLFSGSEEDNLLTIWDVDKGVELFRGKQFDRLIGYHKGCREFLEINETGEMRVTTWSVNS